MPEFLAKWKQNISEFWSNLDKSQKNRIYLTSVIVVVAVSLGLYWLTKTNYVPLVSNANSKDITEMTKILDEKGIRKYKLSENGSNILIDVRDKEKAKVALAQEGLPKGDMAFEDAFQMIKLNTTESDKKRLWENYKRSTLISSLKMLDNVKDADVDLALPEPSTYVISDTEEQKPKAYVRITPSGELSQKQVQGIVMMVANSVVGLDPKDVTVVDNNARILNSETESDSIDKVTTQEELRVKRQYELERKVLSFFDGEFEGFDNVKVVANPVLDFDKSSSQIQDISNPQGMDGGAVINSQINEETLVNGGVNGTPGTDTNPDNGNIPQYQVGESNNSSYDKSNKNISYDYNRTNTVTEKAVGTLVPEKSTMAVAIWYGRRAKDDSMLSTEFIDQMKKAASDATGIPVANITVNKYKLAPESPVTTNFMDSINTFVKDYGIFAVILLLIIALIIAAVPRRSKSYIREPEPAFAEVAAAQFMPSVQYAQEEIPEIDVEEKSEVKKQIDKFVKQKPDAVAQLLRNWLSDDWD